MATRSRRLFGPTNPFYSAAGVSLVVVAVLIFALVRGASGPGTSVADGDRLMFYCAAGMRLPVEQIAKQYQQQYGVEIQLQYGGSNTLLSQLEVSQLGDLYLAADESYLQMAQEKGLVQERLPVAKMSPVIIVPSGNPKQVQSLDDLLRQDVRVSLANPDQAAMGKLTRDCLTGLGKWEALQGNVQQQGVFKPTVNDVAADVQLGSVDAGIVWDAVAAQFEGVEIIRIDELADESVSVTVGVLSASKQPTSTLHFARYLTAADRGLLVFQEHGYQPTSGDQWSDSPQLTLFAGAVNRKVLEPIVETFQKRHGAVVHTVYNGCGILTAQMRAMQGGSQAGFPDVYMACDVYYMDTVQDMFQDAVNVSDTQIVIAVASGNPKGIASLDDLIQPGVRVAIGQPDQCTIGVLTRKLLESEGIYDQLMRENVVTETATSALLIPSVATGAADAALVYLTDAKAESDKVDAVTLDSPLAQAVQPIGISTSSEQKQLARMLFEQVTHAKEQFESVGFRWRYDTEAAQLPTTSR